MSARPPARRRVLVGFALLLVGFNLRPALVSISPLLPEIRHSTGISTTLAGLLTTIPLACFGAFAFLAPQLSRRLGRERLLVLVLAVLVASMCLRLAPATAALFVGTTLAGAAIAVGNVVLPGLIKRDFPDRVAQMTGYYATMLSGGAAVAAGFTVPLSQATGLGWRPVLALWALPAVVSLVVMVPLARAASRRRDVAVGTTDLGSLSRDRVAWSVTAFMGLQSLGFYAVLAWLPSIFQAHGVSASESGWLVSYTSVVAIPAALLATPLIARYLRGDRVLVIVSGSSCAIALAGLAVDPRSLALLWTTLLGAGQGATLALALGFIARRARDPDHVAQLSTVAQGGGYLLAALGPVTVGAVHELTGNWTVPMLVLVALLVPQLLAGSAAARDRHVGTPAPRPEARSPTA